MAYRCVATSVAGFVQQLAVGYLAHGYWFYVAGRVPPGKDPADVDRKLIHRYAIDQSKRARAGAKRGGRARVQYLRFGRFFVLLATHGEHPFFAEEGKQVRDVRRRPILFEGYAIGCRKGRGTHRWHSSVRIERRRFRELKAAFEASACGAAEGIFRELGRLGFEPYAPVRDQLRQIVRAINRRRCEAGIDAVPWGLVSRRRSPVRPFD
ncbi:MAG: hypothetical protein AB7O66_24985 [Limisphaerales bacterium]